MKSPRDIYFELVGKPLKWEDDYPTREIFLNEISRLRGTSLETDENHNLSQLLKDKFKQISHDDILVGLNEHMASLYSEIEQHLNLTEFADYKKRFYENNDELFVASYPLTNIEARVIQTSSKKHLILLHMGLIHTVYILSKLCTSQTRVSREVPRNAWKPEVSIEIIRDYITRYFAMFLETNGETSIDDHLDIAWSDSQVFFISKMIHYAEKFIIAHEVGHIISGHLTIEHLNPDLLANIPVNVYKTNFELEHEADRIGFEIAFGNFSPLTNDLNLRAAIAGVNVAIRTIEAIEKLFNIKSTTHPPASVRRYNFNDFVHARYDNSNLFLSKRIDSLLDNDLFKYAIPGWYA